MNAISSTGVFDAARDDSYFISPHSRLVSKGKSKQKKEEKYEKLGARTSEIKFA